MEGIVLRESLAVLEQQRSAILGRIINLGISERLHQRDYRALREAGLPVP